MSQLGLFSHLNDVTEQKTKQEPEEKDFSTCQVGYIPTCIKCGLKTTALKSNGGAYFYCENCAEKPLYDDYTEFHFNNNGAIKVNGQKFNPYCLICQKTEDLRWNEKDKSHYCSSCWETYGG